MVDTECILVDAHCIMKMEALTAAAPAAAFIAPSMHLSIYLLKITGTN